MNKQNLSVFYQATQQTFSSRCYENPHLCYRPPKDDVKSQRIIDAMRKAARENAPSQHLLWRTASRYHAMTGNDFN